MLIPTANEAGDSTRSKAPTSSLDWSERRRQQTPGASAPESISGGLLPTTDGRKWNPPPKRRGTSGVCYIVRYKVIATENKNYKDSDVTELVVKIADPDDKTVTPGDEEEDESADGDVPKAKGVKVEGKRRAMKVSWKAIDSADLAKVSNVEIQYSKDKNFKKGFKTRRVGKSRTAATIKFLKKGTYYVRVRNVRYNNIITSDGIDTLTPVKTSSDWSKTKKDVVK